MRFSQPIAVKIFKFWLLIMVVHLPSLPSTLYKVAVSCRILLTGGLMLLYGTSMAQVYPVQATTQLVPPYSVYLSDYATPGEEKLRVILIHRDITVPVYQLRLVMIVEWNGKVIMRTSRAFNPRPISLDPGVPTIISGADLTPYLDSRNIDFVGYSREQYERTKALPEGSYRICFVAYDYRRQERQVSNDGCSFYYLSKNEPPLTNLPVCGSRVLVHTPQQVSFSWMPRNTASLNSAGSTEYEFALYETRPPGRNPNDVVLSTPPVFRTVTTSTQLVYGPAEPMLIEGITYVWRVRAIDQNGRDAFRNNGYSEVCTFRYGGFDPQFDIGVVKNLQAEAETERKGRIWWDAGEYEGYKVYYRKGGNKNYEWFSSYVTPESLLAANAPAGTGEIKLFDLEPDTEYETRIQAKKNGAFGPYSETVKFRTLPFTPMQCGDPYSPVTVPQGNPLTSASPGMVINARKMEMTLIEVVPHRDAGYFKGLGFVNPSFLGGARFYVKFDRIFIDENRNVVGPGRIEFITEGVAAMVEKQLAAQKEQQDDSRQAENQAAWEGTDFHEKIFVYNDITIESLTVDAPGNVVVTDADGATYTNTEIPAILTDAPEKAVIVQDGNGDQWVVQKDKASGGMQVTKVPGGGLVPVGAASDFEIDIVKKALRELRKDYNESRLASISSEVSANKRSVDQHISANNAAYGSFVSDSPDSDVVEIEVIEGYGYDTDFRDKVAAYKASEYEFNKAIVIRHFSKETNSDRDYAIVASGLRVNDKPLDEYLAEASQQDKADGDKVSDVKAAIVMFIEGILKQYVYAP